MSNQLTIYPYLQNQTWVFDDERTGLKAEAFVCGMTEMISRIVKAKPIPEAERGFKLTFSAESFKGYDAELHWLRADKPSEPMAGNWYFGRVAGKVMEGWLCPALLLYFHGAPKRLFVQAEPLPMGIDPIWRISPDDPRQRRFVGAQ